ncbi:MAG: magnesium/cobalt transporter CorA [Gammaproteobacteria bacterium]|nr:magnesium/cobalt transporter CorA [Gammaproteobacteria bacterium]MBI5615010.1 magnesium/cobalt transporter CorA [Gammaproteobacteria bacterium]
MLATYSPLAERLERRDDLPDAQALGPVTWIDLYQPTREEELGVEALLGLDLPTREEMKEIEDSNRLYQQGSAVFLTATVMVQSESEYPRADEITFVVAGNRLVTVRYSDPKAFQIFRGRAEKQPVLCASGERTLLGLLEAILQRAADAIERASTDLDNLVHAVLNPEHGGKPKPRDHAALLRRLERNQVLVARARVSLMSMNRLLGFLLRPTLELPVGKSFRSQVQTLVHDTHSLIDYTAFLATNISFELDAILGMVNIEQNGIIKIFSVAAVVFLPPTLVASIYGMNFDYIPELKWLFGYPWALVLMVASAIVPYWYFKRRGWL